jgi:hypothetical protein
LADVHYYVSQQRGNDTTGDGLTSATAWATLVKAQNTVVANAGGDAYIHVGPGTYREFLNLAAAGTDATHRIIWQGDPNVLSVAGDNPGIVRITGCAEATEYPSANAYGLIRYNAKNFVEFQDFWLDGCAYNQYLIVGTTSGGANGQIVSRIRGNGYYGLQNVIARECFMQGAICYSGCTSYNCIGIGASNSGVFSTGSACNCLAMGGAYGFYTVISYNCTSLCASGYGFYGGTSTNSNVAWAQSGPFSTGTHTTLKSYQCAATAATIGVPLLDYDISVILRKAFADLGTSSVGSLTLPSIDHNGFPRTGGNGAVDIGPWESPDYLVDWVNYYTHGPSIKLQGSSQLSFKFPVETGRAVIKSVAVKHLNTGDVLKPQIIVRGLGTADQIVTATYAADTWEILNIHFVPTKTGVMEFILATRDTTAGAYSLFSDII